MLATGSAVRISELRRQTSNKARTHPPTARVQSESGAAATNDESVVTTEDNQSTAVNEPDYEPSVSSELVIV